MATTSRLLSSSAAPLESTPADRPGPRILPIASGEQAALRAFRRAARRLPGYRAVLSSHGIDPSQVSSLDEVPYTDKSTVFGEDLSQWVDGGRLTHAAELLTSSGTTGGAFSVGVTSRAEQAALTAIVDRTFRAFGAGETSSTLFMNCLPMGINIPTTVATVANPSVHLEMALEILTTFGPSFDRVIIAGEPIFLKELAEIGREVAGTSWAPPCTYMITGGEWVAESWRRHVSGLLGCGGPDMDPTSGVLVSMGAAELGLHCLFETPELRAVRQALGDSAIRRHLFGSDTGYSPSLFAFDPDRVHLEERLHADGTRTLVATHLTPRPVPLVRYDLGDLAHIVPAERMNAILAEHGVTARVSGQVVAVWGRAVPASGARWSIRPELIKERIYATPADAACMSGRFHLQDAGSGPRLHIQLRDGAGPRPGLGVDLERFLQAATGAPAQVLSHHHREYPFHLAGDYQHKPRYATSVGGSR